MNEFNLTLAEARNRLACDFNSTIEHVHGSVYKKLTKDSVKCIHNGLEYSFENFNINEYRHWSVR